MARPIGSKNADGLTPKQRRFVKEYLIDLNATQAAIRAGYSKHCAAEIGAENLRKPQISGEIEKAQAKLAEKTGITAERVLNELALIGFSDPRAVMDWDCTAVTLKRSKDLTRDQAAMVAEVAQTKDGMRIKLHSKTDALAKLGQHLGLFKDKVEHSGPNGGPIQTENVSDIEVARRIAFALEKGKRSMDKEGRDRR